MIAPPLTHVPKGRLPDFNSPAGAGRTSAGASRRCLWKGKVFCFFFVSLSQRPAHVSRLSPPYSWNADWGVEALLGRVTLSGVYAGVFFKRVAGGHPELTDAIGSRVVGGHWTYPSPK